MDSNDNNVSTNSVCENIEQQILPTIKLINNIIVNTSTEHSNSNKDSSYSVNLNPTFDDGHSTA